MSEYRNSVEYAGLAEVHGLIAALAGPHPADRRHAREA